MSPIEISVLMSLLAGAAGVAMWHSLHAINRMSPRTSHGVRWAHLLKAAGNFGVLLSVLDYLMGDPYAWPWLMLLSVTSTSLGTAVMCVMFNRGIYR